MTKAHLDLPPSFGVAGGARWTPDQQIVALRERHKIDPVRVVGCGPSVHPLPLAIHQISPHWTWKGQAMDVDRYMDAQRASGVIVLKDGVVIFERYGLGRTAQDRWDSASMAKGFTAILVGAAIQDGYINSLDALVADYIPELKGSAYDGVTVRDLTSMTSGVKWNEDYNDPNADVSKFLSLPVVDGVNPMIAYMRRLPRANRPGTKFHYNSGDVALAGIIVTRATGKPLSQYLSDKLWRPYGMEKEATWMTDAAGQELASGGFGATLRDYARIGQFMLDGGRAGNVQVLPPGWLAEATSALVTCDETPGFPGYGYYWRSSKNAFAATGYAGQRVIVHPKDKVVIAINSALPNPQIAENVEQLTAFAEALHAAAVAQPIGPARHEYQR
ncbi:CubicO group peptidase (beta-lactamase class C family) [Bradyrhizobium japonicum]